MKKHILAIIILSIQVIIFSMLIAILIKFSSIQGNNYQWRDCYSVSFLFRKYTTTYHIVTDIDEDLIRCNDGDIFKKIQIKFDDTNYYLRMVTLKDEIVEYNGLRESNSIIVNYI